MSIKDKDDISVLIDYVLGSCEVSVAETIRRRIEEDADFARLHQNIVHTFAAMRLAPPPAPPQDLIEATMARIRQQVRISQLIAREESTRRVSLPTFSMRELGAVAAAVLILAAVFIPSINQGRNLAQRNVCASNVGRIGTAMLTYANDNNDYLPSADSRLLRWLPSGEAPAVSNSAALFKLIRGKYQSPVVFQCPAVGGESFAQAGLIDFPASRFISYSYQHAVGPSRLRRGALHEVAGNMAILADTTPLFRDGRFRPSYVRALASQNHRQTGQNVLYLTGRVIWADKPNVGVRGNNIFLAEGILDYDGIEQPTDATDTFLLPNYSGSHR